jgi:hypothetical protein
MWTFSSMSCWVVLSFHFSWLVDECILFTERQWVKYLFIKLTHCGSNNVRYYFWPLPSTNTLDSISWPYWSGVRQSGQIGLESSKWELMLFSQTRTFKGRCHFLFKMEQQFSFSLVLKWRAHKRQQTDQHLLFCIIRSLSNNWKFTFFISENGIRSHNALPGEHFMKSVFKAD